jgi:protein-S-isoprenylcysteine O-methyltransferase Ste14
MGATAQQVRTAVAIKASGVNRAGLRNAASNILLGAIFFATAFPTARRYDTGIANVIWLVGAAAMGIIALVRVRPRAVRMDVRALAATGGMLIFPSLMRPDAAAVGALATAAVALEIAGLAWSQLARIWMGRSFGIFPANRGIVASGPFRLMRHPVYFGSLMLMAGYACAYPVLPNWLLLGASLPFLMWRINLEESLLEEDPEYRRYKSRVRFALCPGLM